MEMSDTDESSSMFLEEFDDNKSITVTFSVLLDLYSFFLLFHNVVIILYWVGKSAFVATSAVSAVAAVAAVSSAVAGCLIFGRMRRYN